MSTNSNASFAPIAVMIMVIAIGGVGFAVLRMESLTEQTDSYRLDLSTEEIDPQLLKYEEQSPFVLPLGEVITFAVDRNDHLFVANAKKVIELDSSGEAIREVEFDSPVRAITVSDAPSTWGERVFVASNDAIHVYDKEGTLQAAWPLGQQNAVVTAIAIDDSQLFVADAANRVVLRLNQEGEIIDRLGDGAEGIPSARFIVPSDCFDLVATDSGLLHVVNPGARRVETYASDGALEMAWGRSGSDIASFFGCCNPAYLAQLPDGKFVTSEKGIPRIKIFRPDGQLDAVVADTAQLKRTNHLTIDARNSAGTPDFQVAADSLGRILVLDRNAVEVRVFALKNSAIGT